MTSRSGEGRDAASSRDAVEAQPVRLSLSSDPLGRGYVRPIRLSMKQEGAMLAPALDQSIV